MGFIESVTNFLTPLYPSTGNSPPGAHFGQIQLETTLIITSKDKEIVTGKCKLFTLVNVWQ